MDHPSEPTGLSYSLAPIRELKTSLHEPDQLRRARDDFLKCAFVVEFDNPAVVFPFRVLGDFFWEKIVDLDGFNFSVFPVIGLGWISSFDLADRRY